MIQIFSIRHITEFGNLVVTGSCGLLAIVWLTWRWGVALALAFAWPLAAAFLATLMLKLMALALGWPMRWPVGLISYTAPSGHASLAAAVYGGAAFLAARQFGGLASSAIKLAAVALIVLVAVSRMLLQVHGLGDVLAGLAIGGVAAWLASGVQAVPARLLHGGAMLLAMALLALALVGSGLRFDSTRWL